MKIARRKFLKAGLLYLPAGHALGSVIFRSNRDRQVAINPLTLSWLAQITTNGGTPPPIGGTIGTAINALFNDLDTCAITSKILDMCLFVPGSGSLIVATTPLIQGTGIQNPWVNTSFVSGDLGANGLSGGSGKNLDPGFRPAFAGPQFSTTSSCLFFYAYNANTAITGTEMGTSDGNLSAFLSNFNTGGLGTVSWLHGNVLNVATAGNGFYLASRISSGDDKIYFANSGTAWSAIGISAAGGGALPTTGYLVFAFNNNGVVSQWTDATLSCAGMAAGLTSTEGQCLYNALQRCLVSLGGGYR